MRRYFNWTLAVVALVVAGIAAGVYLPASSASTTKTDASKVTINVTATEWAFKLSKRSVPVGTTVAFKVTNKGKIGHDFKIAGKKILILAPGQSNTLTVKLKKGSYKYLCTVPGHAASGMKGTFKVS